LALTAQADGPAKEPAGPAVEVRMADGSSVRVTLTQPTIDVVTKYGRLAIPVHEVRRIEFGFRYPDGVGPKVTDLVARLGDGNYKRREAAAAELMAYRELAYPALKQATRSSDAETAKRAAELVEKLETKLPPEKLKLRDFDLVAGVDFTARGRIENKVVTGHTPYFGEVKLHVAEMRSLRSMAFGGETTVEVDASKYLDSANTAWFDTGVDLAGDTPVEIMASGQVSLYRGTGYEAGPKGHASYSSGSHPSGALLARIGSAGEVFVVGERYIGTPKDRGRLYLRLAASPWPGQATGSYKVTITPNPVR
jgi:hypothetical protein